MTTKEKIEKLILTSTITPIAYRILDLLDEWENELLKKK